MRTIVLAILVTACGAAEKAAIPQASAPPTSPAPGGQQQPTPTVMLIADEAALPACDAAAKDRLVYVKSKGNFKHCDGSAWVDIDLRGKDGATGKDGAAGKDGANGTNGANGLSLDVEKIFQCDRSGDLNPDSNVTESGLDFQITKFKTGDFFCVLYVCNRRFQNLGRY